MSDNPYEAPQAALETGKKQNTRTAFTYFDLAIVLLFLLAQGFLLFLGFPDLDGLVIFAIALSACGTVWGLVKKRYLFVIFELLVLALAIVVLRMNSQLFILDKSEVLQSLYK